MPFLADEEATAAFGGALAAVLRPGDVVCLHGDLGAGKSALARAVIRRLTGDPAHEVPSPTFTLVQTYDTEIGPVWHFDLYRLSDAEEAIELGWEEALASGTILLEWPDRLGPLLPPDRVDVSLAIGPQGSGRDVAVQVSGCMAAERFANLSGETGRSTQPGSRA